MRWAKRLGILFVRLMVLGVGAALLISLPDMPSDDVLRYKNAIVTLVSLILSGKMLFDTFFYERFPF
jgi:hypothetical protein